MRIGELSHATGVSTRALRYYEEQGLIHSQRLANGYRAYGPEAIETVEFIQDLFAAGLSSQILRDIMPCITEGHDQAACTDLMAQVQHVRDNLLDQEQRLRGRRERLEQYLTGQRSPRGRSGVARPQAVEPH
ncbi:MerR family transcriptional regulator [Amycolatopsis sp. RM579]|uniref:MerR family transcriptional regulator n=1 Tax=Amycolatopsis pithecellobii TaxID=664692 RepID=A0A6N7ZCD1_9PSEU|nr:MerR family transcriptional regulator [Amycolatopsis pithecellobii]